MRNRSTNVIAVGLTVALHLYSIHAHAQQESAVQRGEEKFEYMCAPCHGAGIGDDGRESLPGTDALRIKYRGALPALLTERTDLTFESIRAYLRRGVFSMPPFRPTEITDDEIRDIAAFIADSAHRAETAR
jgi:mono/diheme cytochrome c family protein